MALLAACALFVWLQLTHSGCAHAQGVVGAQANRDEELVYLDPGGVIHVFDPVVADGGVEVAWESPTAGWQQIALGDFNADGDVEIAAISSLDGNRLAIFDPVAEGLPPGEADGAINGIPWKLLYEETLTGPPLVVAAGEFDLEAPADELVFYYRMPSEEIIRPDDPYRFVIRRAVGESPDGAAWDTILTHDSGNPWNKIIPGNYDGSGIDELALILTDQGNLTVYRIFDGRLDRIRRTVDVNKEWQDGDAGQFIVGGQEELAVGREADLNYDTLFVTYFLSEDVWPDHLAEYNDPPPRVVFMGDLNGNGDDEVVVLREVPTTLVGRARLFVRNHGSDPVGLGELPLDADNGYRAGVAGDIDGDGRDEVVIMRNNRIRIFTEPEASSSFTDEEVTAGPRLILSGNLDANGLSGESRLGASPPAVEDVVVAGTSGGPYVVSVSDVVNGRSLPFSYLVDGSPTWLEVSTSSDTLPANFTLTLDATELVSGTYGTQLIIETAEGASVNSPYAVDISMTVQPGVALDPAEIVAALPGCGDDDATRATASYSIDVNGTPDATYTLSLVPDISWANIDPGSGTIPGSAVLTVDATTLDTGAYSAEVVAQATVGDGQASARSEVILICAEDVIQLPVLSK